MTSASALADTVALLLFQNIKKGIETGRIADLETAQIELKAAMTELDGKRLLEGPCHINDLVGQALLEIGSLREKVARCELQLAEFRSQAEAIKEETTQIVARTNACTLLVEQQQKENVKVLAAMEGMKANVTPAHPPCLAPAPSPVDPTSSPTSSRMAVVSFPGGPRTITIHPPNSPNYQSIIRDENGDVILTLRGTKPLRREGAFQGPIEEIDWHEIRHVYSRDSGHRRPPSAPPVPRWPDRSQPPSCSAPLPARCTNDIVARQYQLSTNMQTDTFGRVLPFENLAYAKSPSLPTGMSSSQSHSQFFQDLESPQSVKAEAVLTPCSTPSPLSPTAGRGKKRARQAEEESREEALSLVDSWVTVEQTTPKTGKHRGPHPPEGPTKRKKARASTSMERLSAAPCDPTRTV